MELSGISMKSSNCYWTEQTNAASLVLAKLGVCLDNCTAEMLQKLLNNELKIRSKKYLVQSRSFAEMLEATIRRYQNRTIEAAQVIAELIELAKQMRKARSAAKNLA